MFLPYFKWINNKNYFGPPHSPRPTITNKHFYLEPLGEVPVPMAETGAAGE